MKPRAALPRGHRFCIGATIPSRERGSSAACVAASPTRALSGCATTRWRVASMPRGDRTKSISCRTRRQAASRCSTGSTPSGNGRRSISSFPRSIPRSRSSRISHHALKQRGIGVCLPQAGALKRRAKQNLPALAAASGVRCQRRGSPRTWQAPAAPESNSAIRGGKGALYDAKVVRNAAQLSATAAICYRNGGTR